MLCLQVGRIGVRNSARLSSNVYELIPYAHLIEPEEQANIILSYITKCELVSMSNHTALFDVSYESESSEILIAFIDIQNPFKIALNGLPLLPLIGIGGTWKIVKVLFRMYLLNNA